MSVSPLPAPADRRDTPCSRPAPRALLAPRTVQAISILVLLAIVLRLYVSEGGLSTVLALFVCCSTGAIVALLTRRLLIAVAVMAAQVVLVTLASALKLKYMNMVLHAYDLTFYLTSITNLSFLWDSYRVQSLMIIGALIASALVFVAAWRLDPIRISRPMAAGAVLFFSAGSIAAGSMASERRHSQFEFEGMYLSTFYRSWAETIETMWRGQLLEAAPRFDGPLLRLADSCETKVKPPHIILIHHESTAPPALFPTLSYDKGLDGFFKSDDGRSYKLRVETYGGASVLTEFSVMTGLSTYAFGGMRQFVQRLMSGKIKETIPKVMTKCGYRNVMFYPMLKTFTSADRFFKGAGIEEMFDLRAQKAKRVNERDRFYYDNVIAEIERHIADSNRPLFTFVETMATHWPYDKTYEPHMEVPGGGKGTPPEIHEYLRRLWLSSIDYQHLTSELEQRFPGERFLIVRYGDHQPMATRMLLGFDEQTEAEDVAIDRSSVGFLTFFAVNGVNFVPKPFYSPPTLDVPYLSTVLLEAAGLPLSDAYKKRQKLKQMCDGHSSECHHRDQVLSFHRQLIDSGLVSAR
jgi:phosphoglycerol transferase MdoB-like AlkP superfamily enzyme